ncbi:carbonic anhydrase [Ornithobacterium rhinotracheale]|uniref:carbonic anhydrase n=1 Tax=Ornithobacterium rhinotracheale TaxID=28251 RepID=UPI00129C7786|nr:carbonic anhydrase [Ornithobacterium rhinotracheale]MRJ07581.1 carbonic anhydrase [Ornithobacterium rhinotracheale]UOH78180.1 carbonic anhydrase [Ornithobacterium rhinotracheale]
MLKTYDKIFKNNEDWVKEKLGKDADFFKKMAEGQSPEFLYIGCSDSRVTTEELMGMKPGEVFVHRNIANVVSTLDMSATAVIQYAVEHLKVKHIIVCGHYGCGGVKAAMLPEDYGLLNPWLRNIRDVYRLHRVELDAIEDDKKRYDRLVELNVEEQCVNVIKMACVQERYILDDYPIVHGWVFDIATGKLIDLNIDFEQTLSDIQKIYNLTNSDWVMSRAKNKNFKK